MPSPDFETLAKIMIVGICITLLHDFVRDFASNSIFFPFRDVYMRNRREKMSQWFMDEMHDSLEKMSKIWVLHSTHWSRLGPSVVIWVCDRISFVQLMWHFHVKSPNKAPVRVLPGVGRDRERVERQKRLRIGVIADPHEKFVGRTGKREC